MVRPAGGYCDCCFADKIIARVCVLVAGLLWFGFACWFVVVNCCGCLVCICACCVKL